MWNAAWAASSASGVSPRTRRHARHQRPVAVHQLGERARVGVFYEPREQAGGVVLGRRQPAQVGRGSRIRTRHIAPGGSSGK